METYNLYSYSLAKTVMPNGSGTDAVIPDAARRKICARVRDPLLFCFSTPGHILLCIAHARLLLPWLATSQFVSKRMVGVAVLSAIASARPSKDRARTNKQLWYIYRRDKPDVTKVPCFLGPPAARRGKLSLRGTCAQRSATPAWDHARSALPRVKLLLGPDLAVLLPNDCPVKSRSDYSLIFSRRECEIIFEYCRKVSDFVAYIKA